MKFLSVTAALLAAGALIGPAAADDSDTLTIGAAISMTGWDAPYDSPVMDGFNVALDEFNKAGGIAGKFKVKVITADNRSDNAQNAIVTQDLIDQGAHLIFATCDSSMVHASAQIIVDAKIPAISTCSSSPTLPITGHGYIFANAVTDNVQGAAQATYAYETGYRKAYLLQVARHRIHADAQTISPRRSRSSAARSWARATTRWASRTSRPK